MKGVAKLVEEGLHLAQTQQRGRILSGLRQVHHHAHVRTDVLALVVDVLTLEIGHPGTALLALAGMEVGIEHGQVTAVAVEYLIGFHVGVVDGYLAVLAERDAVELVGQAKHALNHFRQLEIRTEHL